MRWLVRFEKDGVPRTVDVDAPTAEEARVIASAWFGDMEWVSTVPETKTSRYVANSERTGPRPKGGRMMRPSQSLLAGAILAAETVAVVAFFAAVRLKHPDLTETRLFLDYWHIVLGWVVVMGLFALIAAREAGKKGRRR